MTDPRLRRLHLALLAALPFLFYLPVVAGTARFRFGDFITQFWSFATYKSQALWSGQLPLWTPYLFAGYPFAAEPQAALFYPPGWLTVLINGAGPLSVRLYELEILAHFSLAAVGTFLLLERLTRQPAAALLGAVTFAFGGFATSWAMLQSGIWEAAAWLPWVLYALHRGLSGPARWLPAAGVFLGLSLLAGHPQIAHYILWTALAFLLAYGIRLRFPWRERAWPLALGTLVAAGLPAVQWVPSLELALHSTRPALGFQAVAQGFAWGEYLQLLRPPPPPFWAPLYVGLLPLGLALLALARRDFHVGFWLTTALVSALLSVPQGAPLFRAAYLLVPSFRIFTRQERVSVVFAFALAVLAALGLAHFLRRVPHARWAGGVVVALALAELYAANHVRSVEVGRPSELAAPPPVLSAFSPGPGQRVFNEHVLRPNYGIAYGYEDLEGESPLSLRRYRPFLEGAVPRERVWQLLNVRYVATWAGGLDVPYETVAEGQAWTGGPLYVHRLEVPGPGPAWWVAEARETRDPLVALRDPAFDPLQTVLLERPAGPPAGCREPGRVQAVPGRLEIRAPCPGWLVLSHIWYPGWQALVNGRARPLERANLALSALELPAGDHTVELRYRPRSFLLGAAVSLTSLASLLLAGLYAARRR